MLSREEGRKLFQDLERQELSELADKMLRGAVRFGLPTEVSREVMGVYVNVTDAIWHIDLERTLPKTS